jgi:hypothetical protein
MFTRNLTFFGQILHPQWPAQTSKMGEKNGLGTLGVKIQHSRCVGFFNFFVA